MQQSLPSIDRARSFIETSNLDSLIPQHAFQAEVLILQLIAVGMLFYVSFKVSKIK